jgi:YfiH family protein
MNWIKPDWPAAKNIHAAVTLRSGGLSKGAFSSLNPALHVNDKPENVLANRKTISDMLNLPGAPVWLEQVHGSRVIKADQSTQLQQADASYSEQAGVVCAVMTADCLPILLATSEGDKIAAIHAGWRGLLAGVIRQTVNDLDATNIIAWLGPAIGPDCFEVGSEVKTAFVKQSANYAAGFKQKNQNKYLADIYQLATIELATMGVTQVYGGDFCTVTDNERFYSYRRDGKTGRMATLIWRD